MNPLTHSFRASAFQAGSQCGFTPSYMIRQLKLADFLDNGIKVGDSPSVIALNAVRHFCGDDDTFDSILLCVLAVGNFLGDAYGKGTTTQASKDLQRLLRSRWTEADIQGWIDSNYG